MTRILSRHAIARTLSLCASLAICTTAYGAESAVILMYHHISEYTPASTSVSPAPFENHLEYLEANGFVVLPLMQVLGSLRRRESLPEKSVVITFDDGYESVLTEAAPRLQQRNWPFTVFVSTDYIDGEYRDYLNWKQLRSLVEMGATIGNHTKTHAHLVRRLEQESPDHWRARVAMEIRHAGMRIATEAGDAAIPALAYPYGEYESNIKQVVEDLGYFALGQHSGAVGFDSDFHALPRFPVASGLDSVDEIALRVRTRPLVIELVEPERHISDGGSPPLEGTVRSSDVHRDQMACYAGGQGRMDLQWIDIDSGRFVARPASPLRPGRTKYNCTAPSVSDTGVYHWFSYLWMTKRPSGHWYD